MVFSTVQPPKSYMHVPVYAVINAVFAMLETTPKLVCLRLSVMSCIKENIVTNAPRYFLVF